MKRLCAILLAMCAASTVAAEGPRPATPVGLREYTVDFGHSIVEFSIGFAFNRVKGRFTGARGTILYDEHQPASSSVTLVIDTRSIDTGWPHRDEHLRTADFFDVERYPAIVFQSERLRPDGEGWIAEGPLTMHGITRTIAIPFRFLRPPVRSTDSGWMILNVEGGMRLRRTDFGITGGSAHNSWFDAARAATMADSVDVSLEIEAYCADAVSQRGPAIETALERIRASGVQAQIDRLAEAKRTRPAAEFARALGGGELVARGLIATGRIADAVTLGRALTELFPDATRAAAVYGCAMSISGDARGAARQYARMEEIFHPAPVDPGERFPQDDENWYYLDQLARTTIEWGHAAQGVPLARAITVLYPGTARAHTTLGLTLAATGDRVGAEAAYARALEVDPQETRALEWRRRR